ncbi:LD-carboxypeptidase [Clostridium sp. SHJSY1]|uniref:S66 peptidase family protein n=1 Tax=Clostridium sp. SHJSY1 TaxID=2942483 RepID=UPI002875F258|nr:LD-carboxypeptidase [Clostridium sp. SHJSY1]MDS0526844.1 LD-carboxypeptidase [Clostridium sp. SHJSY1]
MLKGKALRTGATIGIIAPASPEDKDIINQKLSEFHSLGFNIKLGSHLFDRYGYLAGSDFDRADDLNKMFSDPLVDGIVCFRGGYGSIRTLPFINKKIIKSNPKFFCGYSDITLLLNYFAKLGLITFHGPMISSNFSHETTLNSFMNVISNTSQGYSYDLTLYKNITYINPNSFTGKIVGGNLSMLCSALNTPYEVDIKNSILLIEDVDESPYAIDRMLTQLICNKKFKNCNGIFLGSFNGCTLSDYSKSLKLEEVFIDRLKPLGIPIVIGFPFGHSYPNLTIPIGCYAKFSYDKKLFTIEESFLT